MRVRALALALLYGLGVVGLPCVHLAFHDHPHDHVAGGIHWHHDDDHGDDDGDDHDHDDDHHPDHAQSSLVHFAAALIPSAPPPVVTIEVAVAIGPIALPPAPDCAHARPFDARGPPEREFA